MGFSSTFESPARSSIKSLHKKVSCRHTHSQSFSYVCAMGSLPAAPSPRKHKLRVLCLHGFRTSGKIMETQLAKLDSSILDLLDMVFLDGSYPAKGKSDVEGFFDPPYYEWFQFDRSGTNYLYQNLKECIEFISDFMEKQGPFDGLVGFSQGSFLTAALAGMQEQGLGLTSIPALRFVIIISGGVLDGDHPWKGCYSKPIRCPSVHLIGDKDFLKPSNEKLLLKFENPIAVRHTARHTVPRLDATAASPIKNFLEAIIASREQKNDISDWTTEACAA